MRTLYLLLSACCLLTVMGCHPRGNINYYEEDEGYYSSGYEHPRPVYSSYTHVSPPPVVVNRYSAPPRAYVAPAPAPPHRDRDAYTHQNNNRNAYTPQGRPNRAPVSHNVGQPSQNRRPDMDNHRPDMDNRPQGRPAGNDNRNVQKRQNRRDEERRPPQANTPQSQRPPQMNAPGQQRQPDRNNSPSRNNGRGGERRT